MAVDGHVSLVIRPEYSKPAVPVPVWRTVITSFGYDEMRFHQPLRPIDEVHLRYEFVETRPSSSKPDRDIATVRLSFLKPTAGWS